MSWLDRAAAPMRTLAPYVPGKSEEALLREHGITHGAKLASNENPFGPPPAARRAAIKALARAHRYPESTADALVEALAARLHHPQEGFVLGNGSNEVIELVIRSFAGPGDEVVISARGFIVYRLAAQAAGAEVVAVPERDGLNPDLEAMLNAITPRTKVVALANPNNPTGAWVEPEALAAWLEGIPEDVIVLLDEAYWEYIVEERPEIARASLAHPGLVRTRTFSKAWGLAGLRLGYAWMDPEIAAIVHRVREPFNTNRIAQAAALAALAHDEAWMREHVRLVLAERERLEEALGERGLLAARSFGNFALMKLADAASARAWAEKLEAQGVITRPLAPYGMEAYLRVTIGTPEENARFLEAVDAILDQGV